MNEYWGRKYGTVKNGERILGQKKGGKTSNNSSPKKLTIGKALAQQAMRKGWLDGRKIRNV